MQGNPTFLTGTTGLELLATATQAEALDVIGAASRDSILAAYSFTGWHPINLSFGASAAPSTGTQIDNNYVSFSNTSGTLTTTLDVAGTYFFSVVTRSQHGAGVNNARVRYGFSGTATLSPAAGGFANNIVPPWDLASSTAFSAAGTGGQTVTIQPIYEVTGSGTTSQHLARCDVSVLFCGV